MKKLHKKIALGTGASKGIGAAIAKQLAKDGAAVIVSYAHSRVDADRVISDILQTGARAHAVQADVSNSADLKVMLKTIVYEHGHFDILVNNAGGLLQQSTGRYYRERVSPPVQPQYAGLDPVHPGGS